MIASRDQSQAWFWCTLLSWSCTALLSPPCRAVPQVTTEPSLRMAANAAPEAWICCTFFSWSGTALLSPPYSANPQVNTSHRQGWKLTHPDWLGFAVHSLAGFALHRCHHQMHRTPRSPRSRRPGWQLTHPDWLRS